MKASALLTFAVLALLAPPSPGSATLAEEIEAALQVVAVSGREEPAA